jgi:hypothetical protein
MTEKTYHKSQIAAATGLTEQMIHQWIHRGYFKPSNHTTAGIARKYSMIDAVYLVTLENMRHFGMPMDLSCKIANMVYDPSAKNKHLVFLDCCTSVQINLLKIKKEVADALKLASLPNSIPFNRPQLPQRKKAA